MGDKPVDTALNGLFGRLMSRILTKEKRETGSALRLRGSEGRKRTSAGIASVSTEALAVGELSRGLTAPVISRRACVTLTMLVLCQD